MYPHVSGNAPLRSLPAVPRFNDSLHKKLPFHTKSSGGEKEEQYIPENGHSDSYKSIWYSFNLLYSVFLSISSSSAALLLLFPVRFKASIMCSFSVSSLRRDMFRLGTVLASSSSLLSYARVM